jgi:hypothetical protein
MTGHRFFCFKYGVATSKVSEADSYSSVILKLCFKLIQYITYDKTSIMPMFSVENMVQAGLRILVLHGLRGRRKWGSNRRIYYTFHKRTLYKKFNKK